MKYEIWNMKYPTLAHFRHFRHFRHFYHFSSLLTNLLSTLVENVRQISSFYAKQSQCQVRPNYRKLHDNNEIRKNGHLVIQTNKAKTNPIKAKTKPIQTQLPKGQKLMQCVYIQRITKKNADRSYKKTNPKQTQFLSKFIDSCYTKTPSKTDGNKVDIYTLLCQNKQHLICFFNLRGGSQVELRFSITNNIETSSI
jgi:hypothetical protein